MSSKCYEDFRMKAPNEKDSASLERILAEENFERQRLRQPLVAGSSQMTSNRRMASGGVGRCTSGILIRIGCLALIAGTALVKSEELTVRSGSRTITIRSGEASSRSRTMTVGGLAREMLIAHNNIRAEAELPPLQWSSELAAFSQKWADYLIAKNKAAHNSNSPYGENILVTGLGSTPSTVVMEWASESQDYTYRSNACNGDCGHYTQLVWRSTRKVGCARALNGQREIWVCSYDPPGNYRGGRPY
jgi:pathogenesis-related protein 1